MMIRPYIDTTYRQYSSVRTVILTGMAFVNIVNYFAVIYYAGLCTHFDPELHRWSAWAYSVGEITGAGYGAVTPRDSLLLSIMSSAEKLIGLLFIAIVVSLALGRITLPEIGDAREKFQWRDRPE